MFQNTLEAKQSKANQNFLKNGAATGTAAFLVKGNTLHSLFQLPINKSKGVIKEKSVEALKELQDAFKGAELIVVDEKYDGAIHTFYDRCKIEASNTRKG